MKDVLAGIPALAKSHLQKGMAKSFVKCLLLFVVLIGGASLKGIAQCDINTPVTVCTGGNFLYTASTTVSSPTFTWNIINNNTGASIVGTPTANQASINHGGTPGSYTIQVQVLSGAIVVETCTEIINVSAATLISSQPVSITSGIGCNVSFSVTATGTEPLSYQWQKNNADIPGATNSTLNLNNLVAGDAGNYTVIVTNGCSSVTSSTATLTLNSPLNPGSHNTNPVTGCINYNPDILNFSAPNISPSLHLSMAN